MKTIIALLAAGLLAAPCSATTTLNQGHADLGIGFEAGAWDLHLHDEEADIEYEATEVIIELNNFAAATVPANPSFSFLGSAGNTYWVAPETEDSNVIFLGIATEEVDPVDFLGHITLTLTAFTGPGHFFLYQTDGFGEPTLFMRTDNGVSGADAFNLATDSHEHANWAFTVPGTYELTFVASGTLNDGFNTLSASDPVTYQFVVVPEPGSITLCLLGAAGLWVLRWRRS